MEKVLYRMPEVKELTGLGVNTIKILMKHQILPYAKVGSNFLFHKNDLEELQLTLRYKGIDIKAGTVVDL